MKPSPQPDARDVAVPFDDGFDDDVALDPLRRLGLHWIRN
jgi:hypothetical protein